MAKNSSSNNWVSYVICIAIFLAMLIVGFSPFIGAFFLQSLFDMTPVILSFCISSLLVVLLAIFHTALRFPFSRLLPPIALGLLTIVILYLFFGCFILYLFGASFDHDFPGRAVYKVSISGLNNSTGSGDTRILVPVPIMDEKLVFDGRYASVKPAIWKSRLVATEMGPMIELSTNVTVLADVNLEYGEGALHQYDYDRRLAIINETFPTPMYPVATRSSLNLTECPPGVKIDKRPIVFMYIDKDIKPASETGMITCTISFQVTPGQGHNHRYGPVYFAAGNKTISTGEDGWIPMELVTGTRDGNYVSNDIDYLIREK